MDLIFHVKLLFWISFFMIFYAYPGYPVLLWIISRLKRQGCGLKKGPEKTALHKVSLLISAYNEEAVIEQKIMNSLSLDYPKDLLEIIVISDGSSDKTCESAGRYTDKGVILRHYEGRIGKTECLNRTVPEAEGAVIVFSDANSEYERGSLQELVKHFSDSSIGFVTGWTKYKQSDESDDTGSVGIYARLELCVKRLESKIGSCVGADGAIFAIRKELYQPLKASDINDFIIPLSIIRRGYRGVLEEKSVCFEKTAESGRGEFNRQVRITNRTIRAIVNNRTLLNPSRFGIFSFQLFSHKLCRFLVPLFLIVLFVCGMVLSSHNTFYLMVFGGQIIFYLSAGFAGGVQGMPFLSRVFTASYSFVMVNFAILMAWIKYFQGATYTTWSPTQR